VLHWAADELSRRYIRPGKPMQNAFIESFQSKLRDELLNVQVFFSYKRAYVGGQTTRNVAGLLRSTLP
jgi:putative transposase